MSYFFAIATNTSPSQWSFLYFRLCAQILELPFKCDQTDHQSLRGDIDGRQKCSEILDIALVYVIIICTHFPNILHHQQ